MGTLSQRIKTKLQEKSLSVHAFEKSAGLKQSTVQNILQGRSKRPRIDIIQAIARNLGCSVEELTGELDCSVDPLTEKVLCHLHPETGNQNQTPPMAADVPWDKDLYLKTMEAILKALKDQDASFSRQDIITTIDEIYKYSAQGKKQQIDKQFAEWYLKQFTEWNANKKINSLQ